MSNSPFLILDCYFDEKGAAPNFSALLGNEPYEVVRAVREALPADIGAYRGILITGSKANLPQPEAWMEPLLNLIKEARSRTIPTFGICFGHQAIAFALAGPQAVRVAPLGELGWERIHITRENPMLNGLGSSFICFVSHFDEVVPEAVGIEVLASSDRCPVQAYQIQGSPIWGMQFHPEMDPEESEALVRSNLERHKTLPAKPEDVLKTRRDCRDHGAVVFRNFVELCSKFEGA